jgi:hypothetical protein
MLLLGLITSQTLGGFVYVAPVVGLIPIRGFSVWIIWKCNLGMMAHKPTIIKMDTHGVAQQESYPDSPQRLDSPSAITPEELALINQLEPGTVLQPGQLVKRVTGRRVQE